MDAGAEDEAERDRNRAKLYAPPQGVGGRGRGAGRRLMRPPGTRLDASGAQALMAQLAAEDARLTGRRTS